MTSSRSDDEETDDEKHELLDSALDFLSTMLVTAGRPSADSTPRPESLGETPAQALA